MRVNLNAILKLSTRNEGGYSNHPRDPGGPTNHGITIGTLGAYMKRKATIADVKALTLDAANLIYETNYWKPIMGDELPTGLDYAVFDFGINSGPSRAIKELQKLLPGVAVDGLMGAKTLKAISEQDTATLIKALCHARIAFCKRLGTWKDFGRGWTIRVLGTDPLGQYKRKPGVIGDSLNMFNKRKIVLQPDISTEVPAAKARDGDIKVTATTQNKLQIGGIVSAIVSALVQFATDYLPTFTELAGKLEPYKDNVKVIGTIFVAITVVCVVLALVLNLDRLRQSGTHA